MRGTAFLGIRCDIKGLELSKIVIVLFPKRTEPHPGDIKGLELSKIVMLRYCARIDSMILRD